MCSIQLHNLLIRYICMLYVTKHLWTNVCLLHIYACTLYTWATCAVFFLYLFIHFFLLRVQNFFFLSLHKILFYFRNAMNVRMSVPMCGLHVVMREVKNKKKKQSLEIIPDRFAIQIIMVWNLLDRCKHHIIAAHSDENRWATLQEMQLQSLLHMVSPCFKWHDDQFLFRLRN